MWERLNLSTNRNYLFLSAAHTSTLLFYCSCFFRVLLSCWSVYLPCEYIGSFYYIRCSRMRCCHFEMTSEMCADVVGAKLRNMQSNSFAIAC